MNATEQAPSLLPINFLKLSCFLCNLRQPYEINISFIYLLNPPVSAPCCVCFLFKTYLILYFTILGVLLFYL